MCHTIDGGEVESLEVNIIYNNRRVMIIRASRCEHHYSKFVKTQSLIYPLHKREKHKF